MNIKKARWAPYRRIASRLRQLIGQGPVMDGTLSKVDLGSSVRYQLTRKEDGRTKTIYVPARAAEEVGDWTGRWRQVRELLKEMSEFSRREFSSLLEKPSPATKTGGRRPSSSKAAPRRKSRTTSSSSGR